VYSLRIECAAEDVERLSSELWELGAAGIQELEYGESTVLLIAFETDRARNELMEHYAALSPDWERLEDIDWIAHTQQSWPARSVGERLFLAPPWSQEPTPSGRLRIVHNPGLACGTGEHQCTQLALMALEHCVTPGARVLDIGTGSGVLAIAALRLGASLAIGADPDEAALAIARGNFELNQLPASLAVASADAFANQSADLVVANISGTVLLFILDDLLRIGRTLLLTGFTEHELPAFQELLPNSSILALDEWRLIRADSA
jgi:ribosomal protein L11 methyltransferase